MNNNSYTTGTWLGIVRYGAVVALEPGTDPDIVHRIWASLGDHPTIHGILHEVTEQFGTGLAGLPSFAILLRGERLHAILRGDIDLATHTAEGTELVSGRDVATWSERSLPLPDTLELTLADECAQDPGLTLPVGEAVVPLRSLTLDFADFCTEYDDGLPAQVPGAVPVEHHDHGMADDPADRPDPAEDFAFEEDFAMAAQAADAEWNAQLAPVSRLLLDKEAARTIRPDNTVEATVDEAADENANAAADDVVEAAADTADEAGNAGVHDAGATLAGIPGLDLDEADPDEAQQDQTQQGEADSAGPEDAAGPADSRDEDPAGDSEQANDEDGFTTNYDFLFGATVAKSIDNAAVRTDDNGQPLQEESGPVVPPLPTQPPMAGNVAPVVEDGPQTDPEADPEAGPEPEPAADHTGSLLIDSVPWANPVQPFPVADAPAAAAEHAAAAQVAQTGPAAQAMYAPVAGEPYDPDHDGHTILRSELPLAVGQEPDAGQKTDGGQDQPVLASRPPTGPMVLARVCPNGHANPPSRANCSDCDAPIVAEAREVGRPRLGRMHISTGEVIDLDHSLIVGRQPSVSRVMGEAMPRLVQVKSGNGDISRSHAEVRLDGWDVLLVDLKATNGTVLVREGQAPRRLGQGEEAILLNGDIAELGDGVSLLFDGLL